MRISAVVPTLGLSGHLAPCLQSLADCDEIIIADGEPGGGTNAIAHQFGARVVEAHRGRGAQLAYGAAAASGDILLFLHSDTRLSAGWLDLARSHAARSARPACFRLALDDHAWQARVIERAVALRTRLFGLPYGDQGLLVSRAAYDRSGGFRPLPLMEDVDLLRRIERPVMLDAAALTSAERWRRDGWARRSLLNLACYSSWRLGISPARIAGFYDRRRPASPSLPGRAAPAE